MRVSQIGRAEDGRRGEVTTVFMGGSKLYGVELTETLSLAT